MCASLTAYWIKSPCRHAPHGFGVTARSLDDALAIICAFDGRSHLPNDFGDLQITEGIAVAELDQFHVVPNMGPIVVRGIWYPFVAVGLPRWVEERIAEQQYN